jgi:hypothetical protein
MAGELAERVSAIIPARNEEANIERAVRSVAAQEGVREIIAVDDQSSDRTGIILEGLAPEIPQLRRIRIESLPEGWMGKANALATGARNALGEWLLFTDADTEHRPGSLVALLTRAESNKIDLLSLSPGQRVPTWWEKAVIPLVYVGLAREFQFEEVSDPNSAVAAANGQYILIRRTAYDRIGGHESVRAEVLDDVALARNVKASGGRILFLPGAEWAETRMYGTFRAMWEGWTKNLYTLFGGTMKNTMRVILKAMVLDWLPGVTLPIFVFFLGLAVLKREIPASLLSAVAICLLLVSYEQTKYRQAVRGLGFSSGVAKYVYLGAPLFSLLLLNSARAHYQGRVRWKGRDYPTRRPKKGDE